MNRLINFCIVLMLSIATVSASTLESIFKEFRQAKSVKIEFEQGDILFTLYSAEGKYRLESENSMVLFDGKDIYSYNNETKELVIEQLKENSLLSNPMNLLSLNSDDFNFVEMDGEFQVTPYDIDEMGVKSIKMVVKQDSIKTISVTLPSDDQFTIDIKSQELNVDIEAKNFIFNKRSYPDAEIIDFRD